MLSFLVFDWLYLLLILGSLGLAFAVEFFVVGWAITLSIVIAGISIYVHPEIITYAKEHPTNLLLWVLGYLAIGVLWSGAKWIGFIRKKVARYYEIKERCEKDGDQEDFIHGISLEFDCSYIKIDQLLKNPMIIVPKASKNKSKIIFWMAYWVPSVIGTIFHDWIYNLFENLFKLVRNLYQAIANKAFSTVIKDIEGIRNASVDQERSK